MALLWSSTSGRFSMRGQARVVLLGLALSAASAVAARPEEPSLKTVLNRAAAYTADYHQRFTVLVAEEHYVQRVGPERTVSEPERRGVDEERTLKSDYIMLRDFAGTNSWLGVREVLEVDGQPVTVDRDRLRALLEDTSKPLTSRVRALADLQAQYNLGNLYRTINVPTLPLEILLADRQPRFRFKHTGTTTLRDTPVWVVSFDERDHPTIVRTPEGHDIESSGNFWIDPATGAVLRTELRTGELPGRFLRTIILVGYAYNSRFDMLLPDDMNEVYLTGRTRIEAHATYSNYRRWEAEVKIK
jgi:hypothetical protein